MSQSLPFRGRDGGSGTIKAVLGPTNTGKTHLAIERMCAHSSGAIGFPLRLLAREVYDRVCAIKGANRVALITGEERIEPKDARWLLCTAEAMPVHADLAFVAIDEAQLSADRERGHIFTDRFLHARGREETLILGSQTLEPMVRSLLPDAEIVSRPRFSTLSHAGARKLSRVPPRSAIVAFSAEQVYSIAEMLRRFRGGSAVVMGALSPQTRNAQVELFQSGEVDYIVATDAVGMGLNLDVSHVAFAGLSKFDGVRQRRLTTAEMAQIAGRAGRHQTDGTFGTLAGTGRHDAELTDEEVFAIEEHRFSPISRLFWRDSNPRFDSLDALIGDLETPPDEETLAAAPEAIDLAVLKLLAEDEAISASVRKPAEVARFWEVCSLPDFRQQGADMHSRFVARLWQDLRAGQLGTNYVGQAIAQLDNVSGDIDTLQGRIAAIRSWAYIAQRPNWVREKEEMAGRAREIEARLSDALHQRLTERFINRRTSLLMKRTGADSGMLPVTLEGDEVLVDGEHLGTLTGFIFKVDPQLRHADRKLLLAAAERHIPALVASRAKELTRDIQAGDADLSLRSGTIHRSAQKLADVIPGSGLFDLRVEADRALDTLPATALASLMSSLNSWLAQQLKPLDCMRKLEAASLCPNAGPELRSLLIRLLEAGGNLARTESGIEQLDKEQRSKLAKLGVRVGALDIFVPAMLRPAAIHVWRELCAESRRPPNTEPEMPPVLARTGKKPPFGYRRTGNHWLRIDMAEKLMREAHSRRVTAGRRTFTLDSALAVSMGLTGASYSRLLGQGGFRPIVPKPMAQDAHGPPAPVRWSWRPPRRKEPFDTKAKLRENHAFAALAELVK